MNISKGIVKEPFFILVYGGDGVGKTMFAANAPKSINLGPEAGSNRIDTQRFTGVKTYADVMQGIQYLRAEKHDFQTVALDSLDWIEPLVWDHVCRANNWTSIEDPGYGKGYTAALAAWIEMIGKIKELRSERGMNIIAIAHEQVKTVNDPMHPLPYDRHMLKLNDKASAKWREAVDAVLFAHFEDRVFKVNKGDAKARATDDDGGNRKLGTVRRAAYDAKNRLGLPPTLPLDWAEFAVAAEKGNPDSLEVVQVDIDSLLEKIGAADKAKADEIRAAIAALGAQPPVAKLVQYRNKMRQLAGES